MRSEAVLETGSAEMPAWLLRSILWLVGRWYDPAAARHTQLVVDEAEARATVRRSRAQAAIEAYRATDRAIRRK